MRQWRYELLGRLRIEYSGRAISVTRAGHLVAVRAERDIIRSSESIICCQNLARLRVPKPYAELAGRCQDAAIRAKPRMMDGLRILESRRHGQWIGRPSQHIHEPGC